METSLLLSLEEIISLAIMFLQTEINYNKNDYHYPSHIKTLITLPIYVIGTP